MKRGCADTPEGQIHPAGRLATVEHTAGWMAVEAEARELAGLILGFLSE